MSKNSRTIIESAFYYFLVFFCFFITAVAIWQYDKTWNDCNPLFSSSDPSNGRCVPEKDLEKWGQTGDFFGGIINPLVGLTTILLILGTLRQNRIAIDISKIELEKSSEALEKQGQLMASEYRERAFSRILEKLESLFHSQKSASHRSNSGQQYTFINNAFTAATEILFHRLEGLHDESEAQKAKVCEDLLDLHLASEMPFLMALAKIYSDEKDDIARYMLCIQLLSATEINYLRVSSALIERNIKNDLVEDKYGAVNMSLLIAVKELFTKSADLYDGTVDFHPNSGAGEVRKS